MLASASKARSELLAKVGIPHDVMISGVDEKVFEYSDASELVASLSLAKAKAVSEKISATEFKTASDKQINLVLGCDSVFVFQDEILGKPRDKKEAIQRWERMSSNFGFLITGHSLLFRSLSLGDNQDFNLNGLIQEVISTRVEFEELTSLEIKEYVETGEPLSCAGGFTLEGRGGIFIREINGCYSNVIGLSLPWLRKALVSIEL